MFETGIIVAIGAQRVERFIKSLNPLNDLVNPFIHVAESIQPLDSLINDMTSYSSVICKHQARCGPA